METLRKHFVRLGFSGVETFIASGNVIFEAPGAAPADLEEQIAMELERVLGYPVATMLRSPADLAAVVMHKPFDAKAFDYDSHGLYIGFLTAKPPKSTVEKVLALRNPVDEFHIRGKELYWGRRGRFSDSAVSGAMLERALGIPMTVRNVTTVRKLAAKYCRVTNDLSS
jgi:uncharacterized protein (DUF1697 family)